MAKDAPVDKLKAAVNALNTMIDPKMKMIGRKKSEIVADFKSRMDVFIEEETTDQLPEVCIDFYNEFIADEEETTEDKAPEVKKDAPKSKKSTEKKSTEKKSTEKKSPSKTVERGDYGESVNSKTHKFLSMISEKPMKMSEISAELGDSYYNFARKHTDTILKNSSGYFYVKGSAAESIAISMPEAKSAPKPGAKSAPKPEAKSSTKVKTKAKPKDAPSTEKSPEKAKTESKK